MPFRHEIKHEINQQDLLVLRSRLDAVMTRDSHACGGTYRVRSLYFDNLYDRALLEKLDGCSVREKYRLRYYNGDTSCIKLEKKSKVNSLCRKEAVCLSVRETQAILDGELDWLRESKTPLLLEFYAKSQALGLRPKTIVDYTREPFLFAPGNVRVTLDPDIRTGMRCTDFLDPEVVTVPAGGPFGILEVKWDAFLPDVIRDLVQLPGRRAGAFSKYAACRIYG